MVRQLPPAHPRRGARRPRGPRRPAGRGPDDALRAACRAGGPDRRRGRPAGPVRAPAEHLYPFISGTGEPPVGRDLTSTELSAYRERQSEDALLAQVEQVAEEIDLDWDRFLADYASDEVAAIVARDEQLGQQIGFTGTPSFVVNGVPVGGYMGPERFREFLDAVLDASTPV